MVGFNFVRSTVHYFVAVTVIGSYNKNVPPVIMYVVSETDQIWTHQFLNHQNLNKESPVMKGCYVPCQRKFFHIRQCDFIFRITGTELSDCILQTCDEWKLKLSSEMNFFFVENVNSFYEGIVSSASRYHNNVVHAWKGVKIYYFNWKVDMIMSIWIQYTKMYMWINHSIFVHTKSNRSKNLNH